VSTPGTLVDVMHPKFVQRDVGGKTYYNKKQKIFSEKQKGFRDGLSPSAY